MNLDTDKWTHLTNRGDQTFSIYTVMFNKRYVVVTFGGSVFTNPYLSPINLLQQLNNLIITTKMEGISKIALIFQFPLLEEIKQHFSK